MNSVVCCIGAIFCGFVVAPTICGFVVAPTICGFTGELGAFCGPAGTGAIGACDPVGAVADGEDGDADAEGGAIVFVCGSTGTIATGFCGPADGATTWIARSDCPFDF